MPRGELKGWSKNDLVREVERLRAVLHEHSERRGDEPTRVSGSMVDVAGDPHARGGVLLDARAAVLMDAVDVCLVDSKRDTDPIFLALQLAGRVNTRDERATHLYLFDEDGAAAIVSELVGLAARIGPDFAARLIDRMEAMP